MIMKLLIFTSFLMFICGIINTDSHRANTDSDYTVDQAGDGLAASDDETWSGGADTDYDVDDAAAEYTNSNNAQSISNSKQYDDEAEDAVDNFGMSAADAQNYDDDTGSSIQDFYSPNAQVLVDLDFGRDYASWNPRINHSPNAVWRFDMVAGTPLPADNGLIQLHNANGEVADGPYASGVSNGGKGSYATITTLPFHTVSYNEGQVRSVDSFHIGENQKLLIRFIFSCRTIDASANPFRKQYVTHAEDDPRLANCAVQPISDNQTDFTGYYFDATNGGIWACAEGATFIAKRHVATRKRYDSVIDAAVELDRPANTVTYYLDGKQVWKVYRAGTIPPDDGHIKYDLGQTGNETELVLSDYILSFGTGKCIDESNPWNRSDTTRLVPVRNLSVPYYGPNAKFYDPDTHQGNLTWGQGAIMTLYSLKIWRTESRAAAANKTLTTSSMYYDDDGASAKRSRNNDYEDDTDLDVTTG